MLLNAGCASLERKMLFHPSHDNKRNGLAPWIVDNEVIGYSRMVAQPRNIWLMLHGNAGQAADRSYALANFADDDSVFILEYPGFGLRKGTPSRDSINAAAEQGFRALRKQYPSSRVCVVSESIGSGPASYLGGVSNPPDKLVMIVPFDHLRDVAKQHVSAITVALLLRDDWDNVAALATYQGAVDIFGAEADDIIPVAHARKLADSISQAKFFLISGGHNDWSVGGKVKIRCD
jgi:hypothetical protein